MVKCNSHMDGKTPVFLRYDSCDPCKEIYDFRIKTAGLRKAAATRTNRATAQINGRPATVAVRSFHASKLPKTDPWYRPRVRKGCVA